MSCDECALHDAEAAKVAELNAHISAAVTGHLKPFVVYPGKPIVPVEEALQLRRAAQLLAEGLIRARRPLHLQGVAVDDGEVASEIEWAIKKAQRELPVPQNWSERG